jgi:hypothetical protein
VSEHNLVRQCGGESVAAHSQISSDASLRGRKLRQDKQPIVSERLIPTGWRAHALKSAGETENDRLPPTQENSEALLFQRGMKAANYATALIPPAYRLVVGSQDNVAGAACGAEERCFVCCEK